MAAACRSGTPASVNVSAVRSVSVVLIAGPPCLRCYPERRNLTPGRATAGRRRPAPRPSPGRSRGGRRCATSRGASIAPAGRPERIDHRSLVEQYEAALGRGDLEAAAKLDRAPGIHLGPAAWAARRTSRPHPRVERAGRLQEAFRSAVDYYRGELVHLEEQLRRLYRLAAARARSLGPAPTPGSATAAGSSARGVSLPLVVRPEGRPHFTPTSKGTRTCRSSCPPSGRGGSCASSARRPGSRRGG